MFEAKLGSAALFKKVVDAIKDLVQDAPFDCTDSCISMQAMDSSHVALVSLKMESHGFENYRCDRSQNLGISMALLAKALKCSDSNDKLTLRFQDETDLITIVLESTQQEKVQEIELKLIDLDSDHLGIPDQDYACVVQMPASEFQRTCRDIASFSDTLKVVATKGGVSFTGKGDNGSIVSRFTQSANADKENETVEVDLREPVDITFAIKYLTHFTKATSLSDRVTLCMSNDIPIVVEYKLEEMGYLRFYLAPKIDDEETMTETA